MEIKKAAQVDLEQERGMFWLLGLVFALSTLFVALEWNFETELSFDDFDLSAVYIESELIAPIVEPNSPIAPEPKPEKEIVPPKTAFEDYEVVKEVPDEQLPITNEQLPVVVEPEPVVEPVFTEAEVMPSFPGGVALLNRFLFANTNYPASAVAQNQQGRVWCSFIVEKDGAITNVKVEKGVFPDLDQEAERVLQTMPKWVCGSERGVPVRVKCYLPFFFSL
ncbi:protein TonB [Bacteroidia bacterium]|nr:protein TonB [Bacteroidia bacterium]